MGRKKQRTREKKQKKEHKRDLEKEHKSKNVKQEADQDYQIWLPGMKLQEGEVLEPDMSAYVMLHEFQTEWPCLSFDTVRDGLGTERCAFPMTGFFIAGTQADSYE